MQYKANDGFNITMLSKEALLLKEPIFLIINNIVETIRKALYVIVMGMLQIILIIIFVIYDYMDEIVCYSDCYHFLLACFCNTNELSRIVE